MLFVLELTWPMETVHAGAPSLSACTGATLDEGTDPDRVVIFCSVGQAQIATNRPKPSSNHHSWSCLLLCAQWPLPNNPTLNTIIPSVGLLPLQLITSVHMHLPPETSFDPNGIDELAKKLEVWLSLKSLILFFI